MALTPTNPNDPQDKKKQREAAADDVLMREVDEAVRQDELSSLVDKYGKPLLAVVVIGLAAFAGYLFWDGQREQDLEKESETLISALDQIDAGNFETATTTLQTVADGGTDGAKAAAMMLQGGIAQQQGNTAEAARIFGQLAQDGDTPQTMRDLATIREVAAQYDTMEPAQVIAKLKDMAVPGHAYFGSAAEMVAMAYLEQGKRTEAGNLFAQIAKTDDLPESLRSRSRRMAGLFGVDAIEDVEEVLEETAVDPNAAQVPGQQ